MDMAVMMLSLRVRPQDEAAFTEFYHHRYLPRVLELVPEIRAIRRYEEWGVEGSLAWFRKRFLTLYEIEAEDPAAALTAALARPGGEAEQAEWARWRDSGALMDVDRTLYRQSWEHPRRPPGGPFGTRPFFRVSVEVVPGQEEAFRAWYEEDYLPKTMADIPTFVAARRYTSIDREPACAHTIYEAADEAGLVRSFQLLRAPWRYGSNDDWASRVGPQIAWQDAAAWRPIYCRPG